MAISISYCISMIAKNHLKVNMKRRNQNQKFSFPFFAGSPHTPRRKRNCKEKFWVLVHATGGSVRGAHCSLHHAIGAYDSVSLHHARGACHIICFGSRCEFGTIETPEWNLAVENQPKAVSVDFILKFLRT